MKILWLCNNSPLNDLKKGGGGWFASLGKKLLENKKNELIFVFPSDKYIWNAKDSSNNNYFCFKLSNTEKPHKFSKKREIFFEKILTDITPDIVHIWGSEYAHSLEMALAAKKFGIISKVVLHIQGLSFACAEHMDCGLPGIVKSGHLPKDFIIGSVNGIKKEFRKRGKNEIRLLKEIQNVIGRTDWDRKLSQIINPSLKYFECRELLRDDFYTDEWNYDSCTKNKIFVSQASYSLKGLHFLLKALNFVNNYYPDFSLYIAGTDVTKSGKGLKHKLSLSFYGFYIRHLISKFKLKNKIHFLGPLTSDKIKEQYLSSNVYILPSLIENSSNSLGEAMLLGVPCICSYVGGTPSIVTNDRGLLYQCDDYYYLAGLINEVFSNSNICKTISKKARAFAKDFYDKESIVDELLKIYSNIQDLK